MLFLEEAFHLGYSWEKSVNILGWRALFCVCGFVCLWFVVVLVFVVYLLFEKDLFVVLSGVKS